MGIGLRRLTLAAVVCFSGLVEAGELKTHQFESKRIGLTVGLNVLLPDGYEDGDARYPVVYLLHGIGGDYTEWARVGVAKRAAGLPVIIAMPEGNKSFYINQHERDDKRWEDYIVEEVIPFVDGTYRTHAERSKRGVSGLSMGGYAAFMLGLRHPELFATVASHSGAFGVLELDDDGLGARVHEAFGPEGSATRKEYDLYDLVQRRVGDLKVPRVYLDCGSQDFVLAWNRDLVAKLAELRVAYEYRELPGSHDFDYWRAHVRYSLERQLEAFANPDRPQKKAGKAKLAIVGVWDMVATTPDDEEIEIVLTIDGDGDGLRGRMASERGEREFEEVAYQDDALRVKVPFRDGAWVVLQGRLDGGDLVGEWVIQDKDDNEFLRGKWDAVRRGGATEEAEPGREADRAAEGALAGTWEVVATVPGKDPREVLWTIAANAEGYTGEANASGERVAFTAIKFVDDRLEIELPYGSEGTIFLLGHRVDGRLVGEWRLEDRGGDQVAAGEWRADRQGDSSGVEAGPAVAEAPVTSKVDLAGTWDVVSLLPDGTKRTSQTILARNGESYTGRSESEDGTAEYDAVAFANGALKIEFELEIDGRQTPVGIEAKWEDGRLKGRWILYDADGQEVASGEWRAERGEERKF